MRVTFQSQYRDAAAGLEEASEQLVHFQRQVSSGRRIAKPSDDPSGASIGVSERAQLAAVEQYQRAADSMTSRLTVTDTVLSDIVSKLSAAQSAAASAQGSMKTAPERESAAQTLEGIKVALLTDLNTSFQGKYIFAGAAATTKPFVEGAGGVIDPYAGSNTEVEVDVGLERAVTVGIDGESISQGAAASDIFGVLDDLITAVRAGDSAGMISATDEVQAAFQRAITAQTRIGVSLNAIQGEQDRLQELRLAGKARLAKLEDANMAEAVSGLSRADAAYQAAIGAIAAGSKVSLMDYLK